MAKTNPRMEIENRKTKSEKILYKMDRRYQKNMSKLHSNCSEHKKLNTLRGTLFPAVDETRLNDDDDECTFSEVGSILYNMLKNISENFTLYTKN